MVEIGEVREVYYMCVLIGYGVDVICLWLIMEMIYKVGREGL